MSETPFEHNTLNEQQCRIVRKRANIYGDPRENHRAIASCWAGLLAPHAESIARLEPLPEHVVALMMSMFKLCRMRMCYHEDNYDDARVYLSFAQAWQEEEENRR